jgi:hypothetical protein
MKRLILSSLLIFFTLNAFAFECVVYTDLNNDGQYDDLVTQVPNVVHQDMIIVLKGGTVHRKSGIDIGNNNFFTLNKSQLNIDLEGSRVIVFGKQASNAIVSARHVSGTQADFESLGATVFDPSSQYSALIDYQFFLSINCFK